MLLRTLVIYGFDAVLWDFAAKCDNFITRVFDEWRRTWPSWRRTASDRIVSHPNSKLDLDLLARGILEALHDAPQDASATSQGTSQLTCQVNCYFFLTRTVNRYFFLTRTVNRYLLFLNANGESLLTFCAFFRLVQGQPTVDGSSHSLPPFNPHPQTTLSHPTT